MEDKKESKEDKKKEEKLKKEEIKRQKDAQKREEKAKKEEEKRLKKEQKAKEKEMRESLNKSISSNGTFPDLFLLSSCHIKIAMIINPIIISHMLVVTSLVRVNIPSTSKTRPMLEIIVPIISKSFLDSVGLK